MRKISSIAESRVQVTQRCKNKKCSAVNHYPVEVSGKKCEIEFWDLDFKELPVVADLSWGSCEFTPLTLGDYIELERLGLQDDSVAVLARECRNRPFEDSRKRFEDAQGQDQEDLGEIEDILCHGIKPMSVKCGSCGTVNRFRIDGGDVLIRPFRSSEVPVASRIRFGKTPTS